jgi:Flp pilus assembly protein TadD
LTVQALGTIKTVMNAFSARSRTLVLALLLPVPALAQTSPSPPPPIVYSTDPALMLPSNLKILAQNPYDVDALTQAGLGAIAVGDPDAAIGFLARAEELSPSNGRIKAALATALTQMERPVEALRLFGEAATLGVAERDLAGDRGLAYDLRGDSKRAQKDYALALRYKNTDEVTRRYALSLGISGEKKEALDLLTPLQARSDQAAWRARAFILAMNGDITAADQIVRAVMPPSLTGTMSPFLRRLSSLDAAGRARAVNFGTMPATGTSYAMADVGEGFRSVGNGASDGLVPRGDQLGARVAPKPLVSESPRDERRRLKEEAKLARLAERGRTAGRVAAPVPPVRVAAVLPAPFPAPIRPQVTATQPEVKYPTARIGTRIAAVDPARLPPEARAPAIASVAKPAAGSVTFPPPAFAKPVIVQGATSMPPPNGVASRPVLQSEIKPATMPAVAPPITSAPVPANTVVASNVAPGFSLQPSTSVPAVAPVPAAIPPTAAATTPPAVFEISPAPAVTSAPATAVITPAPSPTVVPPQPILAPPPSIPEPVKAEEASTIIPVPGFDAAPAVTPSSVQVVTLPESTPASTTTPPAKSATGLGSILEGLETESESVAGPLPSDGEIRAMRAAAKRKADADAKVKIEKDAEAEKKAADAAEAKRNPARIWVQVATGANRQGLPVTWRKLKAQSPKALGDQSAWSIPFKSTNRLLIGPFKSNGDARVIITRLSKEGISATSFSSEAGQDIAKLGSK